MSLRDLGYKPYEGERLPSSHNTWVLLRYGLRRVWASWLVKLSAFFGWVPGLIGLAAAGALFYAKGTMGEERVLGDPEVLKIAAWLPRLLYWQFWLFVTAISLGGGAGAIAEDLTHRAFQFFFAKPITPSQYLTGRIGAVGVWIFAICFLPCLPMLGVLVVTAPQDLRLEWAGWVLPTLLHSLIVATVIASTSVGLSSLSRSRALTMSSWVLLLLVPHVVGGIVDALGDFPWLNLLSLPAMLDLVLEALFKQPGHEVLEWYHGAFALLVWTVGGVTLALYRLERTEVIA